MRIVTVRRISQGFFLVLFLWLCLVATVGTEWYRLRGWPINWILSLDPLTALATSLATRTLFAPLFWSVVAIALTVFLGRFFCGWACPMGTLNQVTGWAARRRAGRDKRAADNRHRTAQGLKYYLLAFLLGCALLGSVQTGLLDPLPLIHRSVNLAVAPILDPGLGVMHDEPRRYASVWLPGALFLLILGLNLALPRFFCRFACPLGALFGVLSRFSPWRIGKAVDRCGDCRLCEEYCEGGCRPAGRIITGECVLCLNCLEQCPADRIGFRTRPSAAGEALLPDPSRRGALVAVAAGALAVPMWRTGGLSGQGRNAELIRPPGSLDEERFLGRCIRCGQCMRVCPTNIIQPALFQAGIQGLWTPAVNYRLGRSGCQPSCIACGNVCPTAAIRPLSLEEKQGVGDFAERGPIRMGLAFVDRTRCLPWAMNRPCIVCQEVCPVSPKAIYTGVVYETVRDGLAEVVRAEGAALTLAPPFTAAPSLAGGDYYLRPRGSQDIEPRRIAAASGNSLTLAITRAGGPAWPAPLKAGDKVEVVVRLQRPHVDPAKCIGCGMCEHECPVAGLRAIRVYGENESRSGQGRMVVQAG